MDIYEQVKEYLVREFYFIYELNEKLQIEKGKEHMVFSFSNENYMSYNSHTGKLKLSIPQAGTSDYLELEAKITHSSQLKVYNNYLSPKLESRN